MTLAGSYARALFELVSKDATKGTEYLQGLRQALTSRGHNKLLPRIYAEFQTLMLKEERTKFQNTVTPEAERTRQLLELYRKLTTTHE